MKDFNIHEKINLRSHINADNSRFKDVHTGEIVNMLENYAETVDLLASEEYNSMLKSRYAYKLRGKKKLELSNLKW